MRTRSATAWCVVLSLIGLGLAGYLTYLHLGLLRGELLGGTVCGTRGAFNCHAVTAGRFGSFLGMPLALWGLLGYLVALALSLLGRQSEEWARHALTLIGSLAALCVAADAALLGLMVFVIRRYCLFCVLTYAVNVLLLVVSLSSLGSSWPATLRQAGRSLGVLIPSRQRPGSILFWGMILVGMSGTVALHAATTFVSQGTVNVRAQMREFLAKQSRITVDTAGDPSLGSSTAPLQIVEFSDFLCPSCQRASQFNAIILANHRLDARFVFKHYPLDTACNARITRMAHPGACQVAAASECAHLQGKFWPFHDLVFDQGHAYKVSGLEADAERAGVDLAAFRACMDSGQGMAAVKRDIAESAKAEVGSTPTFVVNGLTIVGGFTPSRFEDLVAVLRELGE